MGTDFLVRHPIEKKRWKDVRLSIFQVKNQACGKMLGLGDRNQKIEGHMTFYLKCKKQDSRPEHGN
jgi:hypothetical protein